MQYEMIHNLEVLNQDDNPVLMLLNFRIGFDDK